VGINKSICVVRRFFEDPSDENHLLSEEFVLVNPKIISHSEDTNIDFEGCLSIPNVYGMVQRYNKLRYARKMNLGIIYKLMGKAFLPEQCNMKLTTWMGYSLKIKLLELDIQKKKWKNT